MIEQWTTSPVLCCRCDKSSCLIPKLCLTYLVQWRVHNTVHSSQHQTSHHFTMIYYIFARMTPTQCWAFPVFNKTSIESVKVPWPLTLTDRYQPCLALCFLLPYCTISTSIDYRESLSVTTHVLYTFYIYYIYQSTITKTCIKRELLSFPWTFLKFFNGNPQY